MPEYPEQKVTTTSTEPGASVAGNKQHPIIHFSIKSARGIKPHAKGPSYGFVHKDETIINQLFGS